MQDGLTECLAVRQTGQHETRYIGTVTVTMKSTGQLTSSVREYVFYVFSDFKKNMTFYVFLK